MANQEYPKRPSHFAHRVVRLAFKTCAAQEMGPTATLLVVFVAHTEDAKRYSAPPTFFNGQLIPILGLRKWESLNRARQAAVNTGWLHYEAPRSGSHQPGVYWTMIPKQFEALSDDPIDEEAYPPSVSALGVSSPQACPPDGYAGGDGGGYAAGYAEGELPSLRPKPKPSPKEDVCPELPKTAASGPSAPSEFVFDTTGKGPKTWTLSAPKLAEYIDAYPHLDVPAEMRGARQWCRDNLKKRKTAGGMLSFLTGWLNRAQNKPKGNHGKQTNQPLGVSGRIH